MKSFARLVTVILITIISKGLFAQAEIDASLNNILNNLTEPVEVVVTFRGENAPTQANQNLLQQLGITQGALMNSLPIAGVIATKQQIEALRNDPSVRSIYLNKQLTYSNNDANGITGVEKVRTEQAFTSRNNGIPLTGKGVGVLVNDSGVDGTHDDLKYPNHLVQNVMGSTNLSAYVTVGPVTYIEDVPNTDNNSGHGTHVAGTVGGTGAKSSGLYEGVAPGANLIGYGSGAVLFVLDGIGGFDYAITHQAQYGIRVITNSWGSGGEFSPNDPVNVASKKAYDRGIVVLFAAGNDGPGSNTHSPYGQAPWVISVAAGDKQGRLADFSSRGVKDMGGSFTINGRTWTWKNEPSVTAPGVDIVSTRALSPVPLLGDDTDLNPAHIPFYTRMSGTSMATPHVAGITALLLEANPSLSPDRVKEILQLTATNIPGHESWEVGTGYVNAYAAVQTAYGETGFGGTLNSARVFNSSANSVSTVSGFSVDYYTLPELSPTQNQYEFNVPANSTSLQVTIETYGLIGEGNSTNLVLFSPSGAVYSSGIPLTFALVIDRTVVVANPEAGTWTVEIRGIRGDELNPTPGAATPETIYGEITIDNITSVTGANDIAGHPAETSIKLAIKNRLMDGFSDGNFRPNRELRRLELADFLMMGQSIRQSLPLNGSSSFYDVSGSNKLLAESVTAFGNAQRDRFHQYNAVMKEYSPGKFAPNARVYRYQLAYSLIQALGLQAEAEALNNTTVKAHYNGEDIVVEDQNDIPSGYKGYVQLALDLNLINVFYYLTQSPFGLTPTLHAKFKPMQPLTRGELAVIITRTHDIWNAGVLAKGGTGEQTNSVPVVFSLDQNYPNPFNPATTINFSLPNESNVKLEIYNSVGQKVATLINNSMSEGNHSVQFNASGLASGLYIYRIEAGSYTAVKKMTLLK